MLSVAEIFHKTLKSLGERKQATSGFRKENSHLFLWEINY